MAVALRRRDPVALTLAAATLAWVGVVAGMAGRGYAGNPRYLAGAAAIACVLAGIGWAHAGAALARAVRSRWVTPAVVATALVVAALPWTLAPADRMRADLYAVGFQAELYRDLGAAIERAGGRERLLRCGEVVSAPYQVPALAWHLRVHLERITLEPSAPGVVLRARDTRSSPPAPAPARGMREVARAGEWRVFARRPHGG